MNRPKRKLDEGGWGLRASSLFCWLFTALLVTGLQAGPLSERVVFVAPVRGLDKVFLCRIDGRDLQRLSKAPGDQTEPFFSRANQRFYFVGSVARRQQIFSVDIDGDDLRTHIQGNFNARHPNVSPDGQSMLFSIDQWGAFEIAELDFETNEIRRLTFDQAINTYPRYSPDGTSIVYLSRRHGQSELYLRNLADGSARRLTQTPFNEGPGSWRPDGQRIVATRVVPPKQRSRLLEIDLESGSERLLLPETEQALWPVYSEDGSLIVFIRDQALFTYDPSDTTAFPFPVRGQLYPEYVQWVEFPLP